VEISEGKRGEEKRRRNPGVGMEEQHGWKWFVSTEILSNWPTEKGETDLNKFIHVND
jgi:hypothetical protein